MSESETPTVEMEEAVPAVEPVVESAPEVEADPVRRAYNEVAARPRDEKGKFIAIDKEEGEPAPTASTAPTAAAVEPKAGVVPVSEVPAAAEPAAAPEWSGQLFKIAETVQPRLTAAGTNFPTYVQNLIGADEALIKDPPQSLVWLAHQYGITAQQLVAYLQRAEGSQPQPIAQPQAEPTAPPQQQDQWQTYQAGLQQRIDQLENRNKQIENQMLSQNLDSQIKAFAAQTDKYPHFEAARPRMAALFNQGYAGSLEDAYQVAVYTDPALKAKIEAETEKRWREDTAKRALQAKRAANINVEPSAVAKPAKGRTMDETIAEVVRTGYGVH